MQKRDIDNLPSLDAFQNLVEAKRALTNGRRVHGNNNQTDNGTMKMVKRKEKQTKQNRNGTRRG